MFHVYDEERYVCTCIVTQLSMFAESKSLTRYMGLFIQCIQESTWLSARCIQWVNKWTLCRNKVLYMYNLPLKWKKRVIIHNFKAQCVNSCKFKLVYDTFIKLRLRIFLGLIIGSCWHVPLRVRDPKNLNKKGKLPWFLSLRI